MTEEYAVEARDLAVSDSEGYIQNGEIRSSQKMLGVRHSGADYERLWTESRR